MERYFKPIPQNEITQRLQNLSIQGGECLKGKNNKDRKEEEKGQNSEQEKMEHGENVSRVSTQGILKDSMFSNVRQQLEQFPSVLQIHDKQVLKQILDQYKNGVSFEEISLRFQVSIKSIQKILPLNKEAQKQRQKQIRKQNFQKELETFCFLTDSSNKQGRKMIKRTKKDTNTYIGGQDQLSQSIVDSSN